jgi:cytochrome c oxidase subunit 1
MLYIAFLLNIGPDVGWFAYTPLSGPDYSPGKRADFWAQMITFTEVSALVMSVIVITTTFKLRAPGMTLNRIPLFSWATLVTAFMVMFATGITQLGSSFFTVASMMIAIPSGAQIFCWLATLWTGRVKMSPPLAFVAGFFVVFVIGGVTGVMAASVPVDLQIHDTFFIVAHFHYVLIGGAVFPLFGGLHYWFPKLTGRMLNEKLSYGTFWLLFVGFNTTFFPMHILGLRGMTRRIYTYPAETKWGTLNALATAGAFVLGLAVLCFVVNAARSAKRGIPSGRNPWGASGLEWATSSPPPPYGFARLPIVKGREPLWEEKEDEMPVVTGLRTDRREVLDTRPLDAEPDHRAKIPNQDGWPFATAVVTTIGLVGSVYSPVWIPAAAIPLAICLVGWYWPKEPITSLPPEERA